MDDPAYEGGIGGKLKRKLHRRAAATPYDRPDSSSRGFRGNAAPAPAAAAGENGGWLSKIVDPASRLIASSASRFFASVFQKRLTAPPEDEATGGSHPSRQEVDEVASFQKPIPEVQEVRGTSGSNPTDNSDTNDISEFEQLVKQKTFTRAEFEHLSKILLSRTVNLDSKPAVSNEKLDDANVLPPPHTDGRECLKSLGDLSKPVGNLVAHEDEAASPAELAKAYMSSRAKVSLPSSSMQSKVFHKQRTMPSNLACTPKPFVPSAAPETFVRFSVNAEHPETSYLTPRPTGRSAMYKMSRSPYFKGGEYSKVDYPGSALPHQTPKSAMLLGGRQMLKRRSSVLDGDIGSFGPIRRIRQKYMMSPPKALRSVGNLPPTFSTTYNSFADGSSSKPLWLDHLNGTTEAQDGEKEQIVSNDSIVSIPPHSTETARKILQQLDKILTPPKEKSAKLNTADGSPSKTKFQQGIILDFVRESPVQGTRDSLSHNQDKAKENGASTSAVSGINLISETDVKQKGVASATDAMPGRSASDGLIIDSMSRSSNKKSVFQIIAPEDSQKANNEDAFGPINDSKDKTVSKTLTDKAVSTGMIMAEGSLISSSTNILSSFSSTLSKVADAKASVGPSAEKGTGFTFPVPATGSYFQPPLTPTMPSPVSQKSAAQKGQIAAPLFNIGANAHNVVFSSTTTTSNVSIASSLENGTSKALSSSTVEGGQLDIGNEAQKGNITFKSSVKSASTTPPTFAFGASPTECSSNGSLHSSLTFSAGTISLSSSPSNAVFTGSSSLSVSSTAAIPSKGLTCQFGTTTPVDSPFSTSSFAPATSAFSKTGISSSPAFTAASQFLNDDTSSVLLASVTGSSMGSNFTPVAASPLFSSMDSSHSVQAPSSTFPSVVANIFAFGSSTQSSSSGSLVADNTLKTSADNCLKPFPSVGSSNLGFGSSTQSISFGSSVDDNSLKTSAASFNVAGLMSGSQSAQPVTGVSLFAQSSASQFSSSPFGLENNSSSGVGSSQIGPTTMVSKPLSSSSAFPFSASAGSSSFIISSYTPAGTTSTIGSNFLLSTPVTSNFAFGPAAPTVGFSFGASSTSASGASSFKFGSSTSLLLSSTSASATASSTPSTGQPVFEAATAAIGHSSGSPGVDQMNVEDSMTQETNQVTVNTVPAFSQPGNPPIFSTTAFQSGGGTPIFSFGSQQSSVPQSQSPFQTAGNVGLNPGGSFSLGSGGGGGDKANRKFFKAKRRK